MMTDEKYVFVQDVIEKKQTARSAWNRNKGKHKAVKLPSDFMTREEREAMNGEVKSYRLNEPMSWEEFKAMPDDIMKSYIKLIRERFGASDTAIAKMMGVPQQTFSRYARALGLGMGRGQEQKKWDKEGFLMWCQGVSVQQAVLPVTEEIEVSEERTEVRSEVRSEERTEETSVDCYSPVIPAVCTPKKAIPFYGMLKFEGSVEEALETISDTLGGSNVRLSVTWEIIGGASDE